MSPSKGALLISGEPGTGKSRWIREEAALAKATLFRWNARLDRSLREGREILHQQVRSKDRLYVWIEGADDLTQEAQAFLRRILETAAPNVRCCLEVRELWKLAPPILSRCTVIPIRSSTSYRQAANEATAARLGLPREETESPAWTDITRLRKEGKDPYRIIKGLLSADINDVGLQEAVRACGAGSSPWIQLATYAFNRSIRTPEGC
jgi:DNA polymerase III delta prime subunit